VAINSTNEAKKAGSTHC